VNKMSESTKQIKEYLQNITHCDFILLLFDIDDNLYETINSAFESKLCSRKGIIIVGEQASQLLSLYSLYDFSDKIIIGSFDLPNGRKLRNLIESGIATEEELINDVILGAM